MSRLAGTLIFVAALCVVGCGPSGDSGKVAKGREKGATSAAAAGLCVRNPWAQVPIAPPPVAVQRQDGKAKAGFGATWPDWVASHEGGLQSACPTAYGGEFKDTYYFPPKVHRWDGDYYKYSITASRTGRVLSIGIGFENPGGAGNVPVRGGPTIPPDSTTYSEALREVLALLPADARLGNGYPVEEAEGDGCLVQPVWSEALRAILPEGQQVVILFSSGSEQSFRKSSVNGAGLGVISRGKRMTACFIG